MHGQRWAAPVAGDHRSEQQRNRDGLIQSRGGELCLACFEGRKMEGNMRGAARKVTAGDAGSAGQRSGGPARVGS